MFGMSWIELFIILVVALLVIGPDKLPEVARGLARMIRQFRRIAADIRDSVNLEEFEARMQESSHYTPPAHTPPQPATTTTEPAAAVTADTAAQNPATDKPASLHPAAVTTPSNQDAPTRS